MDALGVVGVELLVDRGQRGRRAGDGDPARRAAIASPASSASISARTSSASASSSPGSGGSVQVALGVAHRARLKRGVEPDLAPEPTTSSVLPPPMSTTRVASDRRPPANAAAVGEPRLLGSVEDPGVEREALAKLGEERAPFSASRTALVAIAATRSAPAPRRPRCSRRRPRRRPRSPRQPAGRRCRPRGRGGSRSSAARPRDPTVVDVGDEQARRVRADVDDGDTHHVTEHRTVTGKRPRRSAPGRRPPSAPNAPLRC